MHLSGDIHEDLKKAEQELELTTEREGQRRIENWRRSMRELDKKAYWWIRGATTGITHKIYDGEIPKDEAAGTAEEALQKVERFWRRIWESNANSVDDAYDKWEAALGTEYQQEENCLVLEPLQAEELRSAAQRNRGSADGTSGWTGSELADWPKGAREAAAAMRNDFLEQEMIPKVWKELRQILLLKGGATRRADNAAEVKDLRPISIECAVLRTVESAIAKRSTTTAWTCRWETSSMAGGGGGRRHQPRGVEEGDEGRAPELGPREGV